MGAERVSWGRSTVCQSARRARRTAADPLADLAGETVERMTAETAFKANVAVLKTADEMYGSLLDILA